MYRHFFKTSVIAFKDFFLKILFIYFLREGKGGEREGEKHRCERKTSTDCLLHTPNQGSGSQARHMP